MKGEVISVKFNINIQRKLVIEILIAVDTFDLLAATTRLQLSFFYSPWPKSIITNFFL